MNYRFTISTVFSVFLALHAGAQSDEVSRTASYIRKFVVIPPAPEAAQLGRYGDVPVSYYTGTPQISIPLYDLKGKYLSLPVGLSYNASGIRVSEDPSWAGSGWSLNAGGVITRSVVGNPDNDVNYSAPPASSVKGIDRYQFFEDMNNGYKETQPDNYYYNFAGYSGKFNVSPSGQFYFYEGNGFKIEHLSESSFQIIDEKGIKYEFNATEGTGYILNDDVPTAAIRIYNFVSSWYLSKITSPLGDETISFEYEASSSSYSPPVTPGQNQTVTYAKTTYDSSPTPVNDSWLTDATLTDISISRIFLKKIVYKWHGESDVEIKDIQFVSSANPYGSGRKLDQVTISQEGISTGYDLAYSNVTGRLTLVSLKERGSDNSFKSPYIFAYSGTVPDQTATNIDHWGYANNNSSASIVPSVYVGGCYPNGVYYAGGSANRDPVPAMGMEGSLSRITYPTGGYTQFSFEGHIVQPYGSCAATIAGGGRVSAIINHDSGGAVITRRYFTYYLDPVAQTSSGIVFGAPEYYRQSNYQNADSYGGGYTRDMTTIYASSRGELGTSQGSIVGYSKVQEFMADATTGTTGKTVYYYTNNLFPHFTNGYLEKQEMYNDAGQIVSKTEYEYAEIKSPATFYALRLLPENLQSNATWLCEYNSLQNYTWKTITDLYNNSPTCLASAEFITKYQENQYSLEQHWKHLTKTTNTSYTYAGATATTTTTVTDNEYANNYVALPTASVTTGSDGKAVRKEIKYANDAAVTSLVTANIIATPVEEKEFKNLLPAGGYRVVYSGLYPNQFYKKLTDGTEILYETIEQTDLSTGNIKQYSKDGGIKHSIKWGYKEQFPIAELSNAALTEFFYENFEESGGTIGNAHTGKKYHNGSGYTVNWTRPNSRDYVIAYWYRLSGVWTYSGERPYTSTSYVINHGEEAVDDIRIFPKDAQMATHAYEPLAGITSSTDAKGQTTYYGYDVFLRLQTVKDDQGNIIKSYEYHYKP